ncbi:hypothetical protein VZT92_020598 [Zoarces viviparus]|uniref:Uncharacterized protein n=1 Tax=Zoarces viviparus TaxID=48416 RepID=A0AAW1EEX0_ZOAVI
MLITGALQNVSALRVIKKAADKDNSKEYTPMKGGVVEEHKDNGCKFWEKDAARKMREVWRRLEGDKQE